MQMYPGGGYAEHSYKEFEEDYEYKDDYNYKGGSTMQMKQGGHCFPQPKPHNHNHMHSYAGYEQNYDKFKHGHQGHAGQHTEMWYGEDKRDHTWKVENDYSGHGGKHHQNAYKYSSGMPHNMVVNGGYGTHHHHDSGYERRPCYTTEPIKPVWAFRGIND